MAKKNSKQYGRLIINKLDVYLAAVSVVIAVAALWISVGISVANAGHVAKYAFLDVWHSMGFVYCAQSVGIEVIFTFMFYGGLVLLCCGSYYLKKKEKGERIPGLVAAFLAMLGFIHFYALYYEYSLGQAACMVHPFWSYSLLVFVLAFFVGMFLLIMATFSNYNIELKGKKAAQEAQPVVEETAAEPAKEIEEEPEEEPAEEEEEVVEEVEEEEEEAEEESEEDGFSGFGKRRRPIPFENKLRKSGPETRERYNVIVAALRGYEFNDRISIKGETFSYKREKLVFITFSGATLKVYFNLDPKEFEGSPLPIKDSSDVKKYEQTPACLKIKSNLASRRAISLGERLAKEYKVPAKN